MTASSLKSRRARPLLCAILGILCCLTMLAPAGAQEAPGQPGQPPGSGNPAPSKFSPGEEAALKCATDQERALIKSLQDTIDDDEALIDRLREAWENALGNWADADEAANNFKNSPPSVPRDAAFYATLNALQQKAAQLEELADDIGRRGDTHTAELRGHIANAQKRLDDLLAEIRARDCEPKVAEFVLPSLPDCFEDDAERAAFEAKLDKLMEEQIDAIEWAGTPKAREQARQNADAIAALQLQIFNVPFCPAKKPDNAPKKAGIENPPLQEVVVPGERKAQPPVPIVLPKLPDCFEDDNARAAMEAELEQLMKAQLDALEWARTPAARDEARANVEAISALQTQIFGVPFCPSKKHNNVLKNILQHVTIGVGGDATHAGGHGGDEHPNTPPQNGDSQSPPHD